MKNLWCFIILFLSTSVGIAPPLISQIQIGQDIDGDAINDKAGHSVSFSSNGDRVAVGSYLSDVGSVNAGLVRVYEFNGVEWDQVGADLFGESESDWFGYSVSLSNDGNIIAVGALKSDASFQNAGQVKIFEFVNGNWSQLGSDLLGNKINDSFGHSVSLSGDGSRVAVSAVGNLAIGEAGTTRIFEYQNGDWNQIGDEINGEGDDDVSGFSVSLSTNGKIVAIGAPWNDGVTGNSSGHVRVFEYINEEWVQLGSDIDGEGVNNYSGWSVALSANGKRIAIGAIANHNSNNVDSEGHTRVFEFLGEEWIQIGPDIDAENDNDRSGWSVALSDDGNILAIGAIGAWEEKGRVRIYQYLSDAWVLMGSDMIGEALGDKSGSAVSISGDGQRIAIGAPWNDGNGDSAGQVRIYENIPVSIQENLGQKSQLFTVYPNPNFGIFSLAGERTPSTIERVRILDLKGNLIRDYQFHSTDFEVSELPGGGYYLLIETNGLKEIKSFIKL